MLELTYRWERDCLVPDLESPEAPQIGKYGTMWHNYLRDCHRGVFDGMLLSGKLNAHLEEVDQQANEMMERLTTQMAKAEGVTEQFKAADQMAWVRAINNIKARAEEIVLNELIYAQFECNQLKQINASMVSETHYFVQAEAAESSNQGTLLALKDEMIT